MNSSAAALLVGRDEEGYHSVDEGVSGVCDLKYWKSCSIAIESRVGVDIIQFPRT